MDTIRSILAVTLACSGPVLAQAAPVTDPAAANPPAHSGAIALPKPDLEGRVPFEKTLGRRRSVREFAPGALTLAEVSQLAWAAQGITGPDGKRTTPSARAVYPLTIYLVAHRVEGLEPGVYRYEPKEHALTRIAAGDPEAALTAAVPGQPFVAQAALVIVVAGDSALAKQKLGPRGERWSAMETGFVVQDVYLEATSLGLGTVMVGGFDDAGVRAAARLPDGQVPYAVMPVGRKK